MEKVEVIDLFCGIGGLTHGLIKSGLNVSKGYDIENFFKYGYEKNNKSKFICEDIFNIKGKNLFNKETKVKILVGCAPCQPFSTHTTKYKYNEKNKKWSLINEFLRIINESNPDLISLENVPKLRKQKIFINFLKKLKKLGYFFSYKIVNCLDYGIPQKRRRLVLLASKNKKIKLIKKTHEKPISIKVFFKKNYLNKISAGGTDKKDFLHKSAGLTKINLKRIKQSKPGGTWNDWEEDLILECHKKKSGKTYSAVYGRLEWDKPSPTITTQFFSYGTGRFGHPVQDRALSLREGALLQTFPKNYEFCEKKYFNIINVSKAIGNAVPVVLGEIIGKSIIEHLTKKK